MDEPLPAPFPGAGKDEWRTWAKGRRAQLDVAGMSDAVVSGLLAWPALRAARTVLVYLPLPDEIDLAGLRSAGLSCRFATTRTPDRDGRLTVHDIEGPLEVHRMGFLQPHAMAPQIAPDEVDMALLPGLAFDLWGTRLGRGAGYFDEFLASASRSLTKVGVVPTPLVVDRLPREAHDQQMSFLATEEGIVGVAKE